ncbi:MAG: MBL fold metallo-hydrolase [Phaeodactylibacter sp.]|nr:MBL fold metallo-hydrolase [Phaeodactylibacter sp.]MCB9053490.1 MBL fold metallo-hydrolase [Lewinellaceae bacterium]
MQYLKNDHLPTILPDWAGNPHDGKRFHYIHEPFYPSFRSLLKWQFSPNPQRAEKKADEWAPAQARAFNYLQDKRQDCIVWLGHATFLIQLNGVRLITDPIFNGLPFLKRRVALPFPLEQLTDIDYILLSHDHRDHCDKRSIKDLLKYNRPRKILAPLKLSNVIAPWVGGIPIEEASWYQTYRTEGVEITFLPTRHWSRRGLLDFNRVLWGSFLIRNGNKQIYFGADSGMGPHFEEIGQLFPGIQYAMIGIGAYKPDYMMQPIHTSPIEALQAFRQVGAETLIPMHYGTYDLSDEPAGEPYREIQRHFREAGMQEMLRLPAVGEAVKV